MDNSRFYLLTTIPAIVFGGMWDGQLRPIRETDIIVLVVTLLCLGGLAYSVAGRKKQLWLLLLSKAFAAAALSLVAGVLTAFLIIGADPRKTFPQVHLWLYFGTMVFSLGLLAAFTYSCIHLKRGS